MGGMEGCGRVKEDVMLGGVEGGSGMEESNEDEESETAKIWESIKSKRRSSSGGRERRRKSRISGGRRPSTEFEGFGEMGIPPS